MPERSVYVCFSKSEAALIEEYAKSKGMLNMSEAVEFISKFSKE
jgi:hypothetical protein